MLNSVDSSKPAINKVNIFNFPQASNGFHYRGQSPKFDEETGKYSQLCYFMTPEQDELDKVIKYRHMYSIIEEGNKKVAAKCLSKQIKPPSIKLL